MKEGTKRLAILLGGLGTLAWIAYVLIETECFSKTDHSVEVWAVILGIAVPCFLVPFGIVHAVAWVIRGFKQPEGASNKPSPPYQ